MKKMDIDHIHLSIYVETAYKDQKQGLRNEFQMTGANYYLMNLIQSKTVQVSFSFESFWKIDGCKWIF